MKDDVPIHMKLGYEKHEELNEIRRELFLSGFLGSTIELEIEANKIYDKRHENDLSYREKMEKWLASQKQTIPAPNFTDEELQYILDRLFMSNDPVGQTIAKKITIYVGSINSDKPSEE